MYFHHLHFYVEDTADWEKWFTQKLGFQVVIEDRTTHQIGFQPTSPVKLVQDGIEIWLSAPGHSPTVRDYLKQHPPGLVDIAFATDRFDTVLAQAQEQGAVLLQPVSAQTKPGQRRCQIKGWADICHTLVEVSPSWVEQLSNERQQSNKQQSKQTPTQSSTKPQPHWISLIDHVVINVPKGELQTAVDWYQAVFDLQRGQSFEINTTHSGLCSQVLVHPQGTVQIPINEPSSANSQIQEFLNHNRGAGVQHVALRSANAIDAIAHFRNQGLKLLNVPHTYYEDLQKRPGCPLDDLSAISQQQLLIDWHQKGDQGMLLQTFTEPIFAEPTFFFEIIERSHYQEHGKLKTAQGFGEGNFQALFEAIERAQIERGSLEN